MSPLGKLSTDKASSRSQIAIREVRDHVLILPAQQYRMVLLVSPVNFELKSDDEQDVTIETYEQFVNSLPCPIQILMRTREIDVDHYLSTISLLQDQETSPVYKQKLSEYASFLGKLVSGNTLLSRKFYIVIPFTPADLSMEFNAIREQLMLYVDVITKGLERIGMKSALVENLDLLTLFYAFYNPKKAKIQPLTTESTQPQSDFIKKS